MSKGKRRFFGIDIHRNYVVLGAVDAEQQIILQPRRIDLDKFAQWATRHLCPGDAVVMEATTNVWVLHDLLAPLVERVVVAHAYHIKLIASSLVKTDKRDALILARLLAVNLIPAVWVPPHHVRELRSLITHRCHLMKQRTMAKNRLHGVLFRHSLVPPPGGAFTAQNRQWWEELPLNAVEQLRVRHDLDSLNRLSEQINESDAELARLSVSDHWASETPFLMQMPGVGLISSMTILSAIGDITRFPDAKHLVGYAGLGARVHDSGQIQRGGPITKQGRQELRTTMIEVGWTTIQNSPVWRARYEKLAHRKGKQKAITIIARRLLVAIWHILSKHEIDRNADPAAIERSFLNWGTRHRLATSQGLSRPEFVRRALLEIGLSPPEPTPITS